MPAAPRTLQLDGFDFQELFQAEGLERLDQAFLDTLGRHEPELRARLLAYREGRGEWSALAVSELLLAVAPVLEDFLAGLFGIADAVADGRAAVLGHDPVMLFKRDLVQKRARRYRKPIESDFAGLDAWLERQLDPALAARDRELAVARYAEGLLADEEADPDALERLVQWTARALDDPQGQAAVAGWVAFRLPQKVDHAHLVPLTRADEGRLARLQGNPQRFRRRDGFALTDPRMGLREVQGEVHYCKYCHDHEGDFCAIGFPEKKGRPERGLKRDPLDNILTGCPLEERISEMHLLRRDGHTLAALAMAMVDNPMVPATGHRICNDCMKGCIYQKQDPVNIPQVETGILTDVLALPWGVELYDLLTRWNPLRREQYRMQPYNGRKVLIAGMGPAGFTMAHYLTLAGCAVVGIDGLKIEPLPRELLEKPVRDWAALEEPLDERILYGFGGVAEYGITVRWDKNFLKLIYLSLSRRRHFQVFGGVRLGGTLSLDDAWALGFDHVCIATGAGYPRVINIGQSLARGMRQANDFLMALQLTGAGKDSSLANLQVRLPAVVIGGGLTGIDTATEVQAHYIKQVEKILHRHQTLLERHGEDRVRARLGPEDQAILDEFLEHGRAVRVERERAAAAGEAPDFIPLLRRWGGVTLAYRKSLNASPAYVRNHEEVIKAMEEGLYYAEGLDPIQAELDTHGHVAGLDCRRMEWQEGRWLATKEHCTLSARSIFVAAGTVPNIIYETEHPGSFRLDGNHFLPHVEHADRLQPVRPAEHCKSPEFGPFTSYQQSGRTVSFLGDTHPVFNGSVVKAIASGKRSYPEVLEALDHLPRPSDTGYPAFRDHMDEQFTARVAEVNRSNPAITELWVKAPMAARKFRPGQFFRLQTFEATSPVVAGTRLQVPLLTVSGAGVEGDRIRLLVLQWGTGPRLVNRLQPGDPVVLMGPTGAPTEIPDRETVLVVAGRWGAAVMLDIGPALRAAGNRVLYLAAFGSAAEVDNRAELEAAADQIIWCVAEGDTIPVNRPQDLSLRSRDMLDVLRRYADGELHADNGPASGSIPLTEIDRLMVMGSTGLLRGFQGVLKDHLGGRLKSGLQAVGTVGSPMQCMLKGVCAQCLQWQIDPRSGERTRAVFSCAGQDQPLAWIDLDNLSARQRQNSLADTLSALWLDYVLEQEAAD
ncbi:MAG: FAD-dependent oxidoreductase [Candidatus Competibacterales bacterium]|nr:FAD-dependent oxidoreductase [Candidatus Competibacterales bacterium]